MKKAKTAIYKTSAAVGTVATLNSITSAIGVKASLAILGWIAIWIIILVAIAALAGLKIKGKKVEVILNPGRCS